MSGRTSTVISGMKRGALDWTRRQTIGSAERSKATFGAGPYAASAERRVPAPIAADSWEARATPCVVSPLVVALRGSGRSDSLFLASPPPGRHEEDHMTRHADATVGFALGFLIASFLVALMRQIEHNRIPTSLWWFVPGLLWGFCFVWASWVLCSEIWRTCKDA